MNWLRGVDDRPVRANRVRKSVGAEKTFSEDISTMEEATEKLVPVIEKVIDVCADKMLSARTVTLKVKYSDFEIITRRFTRLEPTNQSAVITSIALELLGPVFPSPKTIRLLGISLSNFAAITPQAEQMRLEI